MYSLKRTPLAAALLLASNSPLYISQAQAAPGDAAGQEIPVNFETAGAQIYSDVAVDADGDFVIAWQSIDQDGSNYGVYAQRFSRDGAKVGGEFLVNTETNGKQTHPAVAMDADGDFVVTWSSYLQDGEGYGIYAQRYAADGSKVGKEFPVNTVTTGTQTQPDIAMDADGDFVIAWEGPDGSTQGVFAQRFNRDGTMAGVEFQVNTVTTDSQRRVAAAMDADGDFIIAWDSFDPTNELSVYARRYDKDGIAAGDEFMVNTSTGNYQYQVAVAMDAGGDFVVAWESNQSGLLYDIYAQRYTAAGVKAGGEFIVNTVTTSDNVMPSVAMDAAGDFVIAWSADLEDGSNYGNYARRFAADGSALSDEFLVNTETSDLQFITSTALDADGDFIIAWESNLQDGSSRGIYAQRFEGYGKTVDLNLVVQDDTDPVTAGNNFVYSLITTNNGTGYAMNVNLDEPLPTGLTYVSDDAASLGWTCMQTAQTLNCNRPFMTAGETSTINVTVTADTAGDLSNTVSVSAAQADSNPADNTDTETTTVAAATATTTKSSGGGGSFGVFGLLLVVPLWLRRRWIR